MTYDPIRDLRLVQIRESKHRPHLGENVYEDVFVGYRLEFRRIGSRGQWEQAPTIIEYVNDRKDNPLPSSVQRSVREEDTSFSEG